MPADETIRIVLVDDEQMVRQGLRMILESEDGFAVVGEAGDGAAAVGPGRATRSRRRAHGHPDAGHERTRRDAARSSPWVAPSRRASWCSPPSTSTSTSTRRCARERSGFLLKRTPAEDLIAGVRVVAAGEALLSPSVTKRLIGEFARRPAAGGPSPAVLDQLTEREREVLGLIAHGLSNREIAEKLFLSEGTVKTHIKRIFFKLDLRDRTQAVILAYNIGLVAPAGA